MRSGWMALSESPSTEVTAFLSTGQLKRRCTGLSSISDPKGASVEPKGDLRIARGYKGCVCKLLQGRVPDGHAYPRTILTDADGRASSEH